MRELGPSRGKERSGDKDGANKRTTKQYFNRRVRPRLFKVRDLVIKESRMTS